MAPNNKGGGGVKRSQTVAAGGKKSTPPKRSQTTDDLGAAQKKREADARRAEEERKKREAAERKNVADDLKKDQRKISEQMDKKKGNGNNNDKGKDNGQKSLSSSEVDRLANEILRKGNYPKDGNGKPHVRQINEGPLNPSKDPKVGKKVEKLWKKQEKSKGKSGQKDGATGKSLSSSEVDKLAAEILRGGKYPKDGNGKPHVKQINEGPLNPSKDPKVGKKVEKLWKKEEKANKKGGKDGATGKAMTDAEVEKLAREILRGGKYPKDAKGKPHVKQINEGPLNPSKNPKVGKKVEKLWKKDEKANNKAAKDGGSGKAEKEANVRKAAMEILRKGNYPAKKDGKPDVGKINKNMGLNPTKNKKIGKMVATLWDQQQKAKKKGIPGPLDADLAKDGGDLDKDGEKKKDGDKDALAHGRNGAGDDPNSRNGMGPGGPGAHGNMTNGSYGPNGGMNNGGYGPNGGMHNGGYGPNGGMHNGGYGPNGGMPNGGGGYGPDGSMANGRYGAQGGMGNGAPGGPNGGGHPGNASYPSSMSDTSTAVPSHDGYDPPQGMNEKYDGGDDGDNHHRGGGGDGGGSSSGGCCSGCSDSGCGCCGGCCWSEDHNCCENICCSGLAEKCCPDTPCCHLGLGIVLWLIGLAILMILISLILEACGKLPLWTYMFNAPAGPPIVDWVIWPRNWNWSWAE